MLGSLGRLVARCHPCYMASRCIQILRACLLVNVAESLPAFSENQRQSKRISAAKPVGIFFSFVFFFYYFVVLLVVFLFFIPSFLSIFYFQFLLVAICWFYSSFSILCLLIQIFKKKKK